MLILTVPILAMPILVKKPIFLNPRVWIALLVILAVDLVFQLGGYNRHVRIT